MNEWRANLWLVVELMIVSVAICYLLNQFIMVERVKHLPNGYDLASTVYMRLASMPTDGIEFKDSADRADSYTASLTTLINNIKSRPGVENVTIGSNIQPYNYNYQGNALSWPEKPDSLLAIGNCRLMTAGGASAMKLKPLAGATTTEELDEMLAKGELLVSRSTGRDLMEHDPNDYYFDGLEGAKKLIGQQLKLSQNGKTYTIGAVVEDMRRGEYEPAYRGTFVIPVSIASDERYWCYEIIARVKPGMVNDVIEDFKENSTKFYQTNLHYVVECQPVSLLRKAHHLDVDLEQRNSAIVIGFLLVTIFLGLVGTFWFRTTQRVSEIAVRKSVGARASDIFRRLTAEGMILLIAGTIPAAVIDYILDVKLNDEREALDSLLQPFGADGHIAMCILVSFVLMAIMTITGIWLPARKAMKIDPATALHAE